MFPTTSIVIGQATYTLAAALDEGMAHHQAGRLSEAATIYRQILAVDPNHADSLHLLGAIARLNGNPEVALDLIGRALGLNPQSAPMENSYATTLRDLGRLDAAILHYHRALALRPTSPEIRNNLANALHDRGRLDEAAEQYRAALSLAPGQAQILYNLANVLADAGSLCEAEQSYRRALDVLPDFADAHYNLGRILIKLSRLEEAERSCRAALALRPDHVLTINNLAVICHELGRLEEAERWYTAALRLEPTYAEAHYNLGCTRLAQNQGDEAGRCFEQALNVRPDYGAARVALCMAHLPVLYSDEVEIDRRRTGYAQALRALSVEAERPGALFALADGIGAIQPFFLAYQHRNDRELQSLYGTLVCRIAAASSPPVTLAAPPAAGERIRVGIVSGFFCDHTVWRLFIKSWITQLDRKLFEVFGYHTGLRRDGETDSAAEGCDRFVEGRLSLRFWHSRIAADQPHVLLYPEIGMDPMAARLAAHRLAPVQCNTWGHPDTSGMPTMDYFLTSDLMEPADGQECYTERLIRLPHLGTYYEPDDSPRLTLTRADLGYRPKAVVYWSGQALYKYLPQYDDVYPRIARALTSDCQFVFIEYAKSRAVTDLLRRRLARAFANHGLDASHYCLFLPPMTQARFMAAVGLSDILLDSIGWSGGKSTLDCLTHDHPIVTLAGPMMRARHTAAILTHMNVTTTLTHTTDAYIDCAARLGRDSEERKAISAAIAAHKSRVFHDSACIAGLEAFLERVSREKDVS